MDAVLDADDLAAADDVPVVVDVVDVRLAQRDDAIAHHRLVPAIHPIAFEARIGILTRMNHVARILAVEEVDPTFQPVLVDAAGVFLVQAADAQFDFQNVHRRRPYAAARSPETGIPMMSQ